METTYLTAPTLLLLVGSLTSGVRAAPLQTVTNVTYTSTVDGVALTSRLFLPTGYDPNGPPRALVCHLHGAGGSGRISIAMQARLEERGWIGVAPDGRVFDAGDPTCTWPFSPAYFDSPDPEVGPGEQDILDLIEWAKVEHAVDADRIYLTGFSYGGRGTYMIGLKNPHLFAAVAPMGAPTDMYEIDVRRPDSEGCRSALLGGVPGDSPEVDTRFTVTSARFLLENAYHLPVFHGHGLADTVASNTLSEAPYLHGWHVTVANGWDACHSPALCFGHTPTLSELQGRHPNGYDWAFMFTPVPHVTDSRWLSGTPQAPGLFGTEDPMAPGHLLGIYDFFERRTLVTSPETVVYKTYETDHRRAYWLELETATPWMDLPAAVRATSDPAANSLDLELVRAASLKVDVQAAQLRLTVDQPLTVQLAELIEPSYDPNLDAAGEDWDPELILTALDRVAGATVFLDGSPMAAALVSAMDGEVRIGPIDLSAPKVLQIYPYQRGCEGLPNSTGQSAILVPTGSTVVHSNDLVLTAQGAPPGQFGLYFYGVTGTDLPLGNGRLCVAPPLFRIPTIVQVDTGGQACLPLDLSRPPASAGAGLIVPGQTTHFQLWFRDPGSATGSNTSTSVVLQFQ